MMKKLFRLSIVLVIAAGSIISCEKGANSPEPVLSDTSTTIDGISVINGRIVFDTRAVFEKTLNEIKTKSVNELILWQKENFRNFNSVLETYENISDADFLEIAKDESVTGYEGVAYLKQEDDGLELVRTVDLDELAAVTNKDGILQINDRVYNLQYETTKEVVYSDESEITNLISTKWTNNNIEVFDHPTTRITTATSTEEARTTTCDQYYYKKSRRRFKHETTVNSGWLSSGISSCVKHQAKIWGVWGSSKAKKMRLRVSGTFFQEDINQPGTGNGFTQTLTFDTGLSSNVKKLKWNWYSCYAQSCTFSASGTSFFEGNGVDNSYRNCTRAFPNP